MIQTSLMIRLNSTKTNQNQTQYRPLNFAHPNWNENKIQNGTIYQVSSTFLFLINHFKYIKFYFIICFKKYTRNNFVKISFKL